MKKPASSFPKPCIALLVLARRVYSSLNSSPQYLNRSPEFNADLQRLGEAIDRTQKADDEAMCRDTQKIAFRDKMRDELLVILGRVLRHVELAANGDIGMLENSGFDLIDTAKKGRFTGPLPAPIVTLKHGPLSGTLIINAKRVPGAASYEFRITDSDPTVHSNFQPFGTFSHGSKITVPDRVPGQTYSVIARCIGSTGPGAWSAPFSIMSL